MPIFGGPKPPSGEWESFLGLWERANLVRTFFWSQRVDDEKLLLTHFLARLRRFFAVDFCLGALRLTETDLVEVGLPEAGLGQLPDRFSVRCLDAVANSTAPVTWNEPGGSGFRHTVVAPLRAPTGGAFGFLMLGHGRGRNYSAGELFLLQALAGELSWIARDLAARKHERQSLASMCQEVHDALQAITGSDGLIDSKSPQGVDNKVDSRLRAAARALRRLSERLNLPSGNVQEVDGGNAVIGDTGADIASAVAQSVASCQGAKERGIEVEVVYAPEPPSRTVAVPPAVKRLLQALVDNAALATRNERVRLTVQREERDLRFCVKGLASNRVADKLKMLFDSAARWQAVEGGSGDAVVRARQFLDNAGGDVYLKSRPGESAEFVVRLPIK